MKPGLWELLILLVIILLLFGTKKLRNAGGDIGSAFKNFKKAVKDEDSKQVEDQSKDADFDSAEQSQKQNSEQNSETTDSKN